MKNKAKRITAFLCVLLLLCASAYPVIADELGVLDKIKAQTVKRISNWDFFYYEEGGYYAFRFILKDGNDNEIDCPVDALLTITNEDGEVLYSLACSLKSENYVKWTHAIAGDHLYATISIPPEEIVKTETGVGKVNFIVEQPGYFYFDPISIETSSLPTIDKVALCSLALPTLPVSTAHTVGNRIASKAVIREVEYEFEESSVGVNLRFYVTGEKTFDSAGESNNDECSIEWKLFDKDNYVVKSGTLTTSILKTGEKFKRQSATVYDLEAGEYRLELITE